MMKFFGDNMFTPRDHLTDVIGPVFAAMVSWADMKDARNQRIISTTTMGQGGRLRTIEEMLKALGAEFRIEVAKGDYAGAEGAVHKARVAAEELFAVTGDRERYLLILEGLKEAEALVKDNASREAHEARLAALNLKRH